MWGRGRGVPYERGQTKASRAHILDAVLAHGLDQIDCADYIVCVVQHGKLHTLPHCLAPSKVDNCIKPAGDSSQLQQRPAACGRALSTHVAGSAEAVQHMCVEGCYELRLATQHAAFLFGMWAALGRAPLRNRPDTGQQEPWQVHFSAGALQHRRRQDASTHLSCAKMLSMSEKFLRSPCRSRKANVRIELMHRLLWLVTP